MKNKNLPKPKQTNYEEWFASLPLDKQMYVAQHVKKKLDKIQYETEKILDSCYIGAMIETLDINLDNCIEIAKKANENMDETLNILNKEGEKYYMKVNNDVLREEIKVEVKALIIENTKINNLEIIKLLQKDYDLARKDLQILIKEAREELANEALKELEKEINVKEVEEEGKKDWDVLEELPVAEIKPTIKLNDGFKINKIELEKNGRIYVKDSEGVKSKHFSFKDITEVKDYSNAIEKEYKTKKEELYNKMNELNKEMHELGEKRNKDFEIIAEIEQIFAM